MNRFNTLLTRYEKADRRMAAQDGVRKALRVAREAVNGWQPVAPTYFQTYGQAIGALDDERTLTATVASSDVVRQRLRELNTANQKAGLRTFVDIETLIADLEQGDDLGFAQARSELDAVEEASTEMAYREEGCRDFCAERLAELIAWGVAPPWAKRVYRGSVVTLFESEPIHNTWARMLGFASAGPADVSL